MPPWPRTCAASTDSTSASPRSCGDYLVRLVTLDLGFSAIYGKPVATVILERLPPTILLMVSALSFAFFFGLVLGVVAARRVNKWPDTLISTLGLVFYATPSFWFGLMAIVLFSVYLQWLPAGGFADIAAILHRLRRGAGHCAAPDAADADARADLPGDLPAHHARLDAGGADRSTSCARRAPRDLARHAVVARHVLRNAMLPMVTLIGLQAGTMLGGSVVVESVFALPGLGRLAYESVVQRDLNTLLGIVFVSALLVITINFLVDILYARLDPRIVTGS